MVALGVALAPDPPRDRWVAEDKVKHLVASFAATTLAASAARAAGLAPAASAWAGAGAGSAVAVWKEIRDHSRPDATASARDLVWDAVGVAGGTLVMRRVR